MTFLSFIKLFENSVNNSGLCLIDFIGGNITLSVLLYQDGTLTDDPEQDTDVAVENDDEPRLTAMTVVFEERQRYEPGHVMKLKQAASGAFSNRENVLAPKMDVLLSMHVQPA